MIPNTIHSGVKSNAERKVFDLIRDAPGSEQWVCLHSLGLAHHAKKRRAEIDFLLLTPSGIFVLEVKGGRVGREGGKWFFENRWGRKTTKHESPFEQAQSAMFALEKELRQEFDGNPRLCQPTIGFGVLFPDIYFDVKGVEFDERQVFDLADRSAPMSRYVERLVQYTRESQPYKRYGLKKEDIAALVEFLRPDFDLVPSFDVLADETRAALVRLTKQQLECLSVLDSRPRVIVEGAAGTGKSVLALEAARREARAGRRVLVLCFNKLLSSQLRSSVREADIEIEIDHVHSFLRRMIRRSDFEDEFQHRSRGAENDELYGRLYPEYGALALLARGAPPYDVLIVDEAQDLLTAPMLAVFEACIGGDLEQGRWRFFMDSNGQARVYGQLDRESYAKVRRWGDVHLLTLNCRNTRQIGLFTEAVSMPDLRSAPRQKGEPVHISWYGDEDGAEYTVLKAVLEQLRERNVRPGTVSVIFPRKPTAYQEGALRAMGLRELIPADAGDLASHRLKKTTYSTVSAFKGLENDVVVLVGVGDIDSAWWQSVVYVGMSRARVALYVIFHESLQLVVAKRHADYAAALSGEYPSRS